MRIAANTFAETIQVAEKMARRLHAIKELTSKEVSSCVTPSGEEPLDQPTRRSFLIGSAAATAIANAVYHATAKRVRDLPIMIEKLM